MNRNLPTINVALRGACAWLVTVVVALQARRLFAHGFSSWRMVGLMTVSSLLAVLVIRRHWAVRVAVYVLVGVCAVALAAVGAGGKAGADTGRAFTRGLGDLLAAVWPSPLIPAAVGALTGIICVAAMIAVDLATHRIAIAGLLPSLGLLGLLALLSAQAGPPSGWVLGAYAMAALALLRSESSMRFSSTRLSVFGVVTVGLGAVPLLLTSIAVAERYDPRADIAPPSSPDTGISPLGRLDEWRTRTPATPVLTSTLTTATRWRLIGLTRYDGRTWMPAQDFRQASDQIAAVSEGVVTTEVDVVLGDLDSFWYPAPEATVNISLPVRVDGGISGFLANERPAEGTNYSIVIKPTVVTPAQLSGARAGRAASPFINDVELSPALLELATTVTAGAQTDYERAERIALYLSKEYSLDPASPAGHSLVVEELFLLSTKRGRDEQFVAAYGLLAAAVGLPVRIAVGFESFARADGTGSIALSDGAVAWPEVNFEEYGWVSFNPVPTGEQTLDNRPGTGTIAAIDDDASVPPPSTSPATADSVPTDAQAITPETPSGSVSGSATGALLLGGALGLIVLVPPAYVIGVLLAKRRRRLVRSSATDPRERAVGAFRTGIDMLVDLGVDAPLSMTDRELVSVGAGTVGPVVGELEPMARLATEAVFRPESLTASSVKSWQQLETFERNSAKAVGRARFLRGKVSARSLRRERTK